MISVERARPDHLPGIVDIVNDVSATSHASFDTEPVSAESRRTWFGGFGSSGPYRLLVATDGEDVLGYASSSRYRDHKAFVHTVEFSVSLHPGWRGQSVGSMLYTALIDEIRHEPVHVALAGIALPNDASIALHKKFGFTEVGIFHDYAIKHGQFVSSLWLERTF